jgi:hypothetical protein
VRGRRQRDPSVQNNRHKSVNVWIYSSLSTLGYCESLGYITIQNLVFHLDMTTRLEPLTYEHRAEEATSDAHCKVSRGELSPTHYTIVVAVKVRKVPLSVLGRECGLGGDTPLLALIQIHTAVP